MIRFVIPLGLILSAVCIHVISAKSDICFLNMENGKCGRRLKRYFYNATSQQCEEFSYTGCGGNKNSFDTVAECQKECADVCKLPKKAGPCEAAFPRYFYNTKTGACEYFTFGGCEPNANNFPTMDDCRRRCPDINKICLLPEDQGEYQTYDKLIIRWRFDNKEWACVPFIFLGKGGNENSFPSRRDCKESCPIGDLCLLPMDHGPCSQDKTRWHYDAVSGVCKEFEFGGCFGNENNFKSKLDCQLRCPQTSICNLPKAGEYKEGDMVNGKAVKPLDRFYYDRKRDACRYFQYQGYGGNENNFETGEKCQLMCPVMSKCALGKNRGSSKKYSLKWYYDVDKMKCRDFIYYGEGGNDNRFSTKRECQDDCGGCSKPKDRGPCLAFYTRYYYNTTSRTCQSFVFGGCRANANNFMTFEDCIESCVS